MNVNVNVVGRRDGETEVHIYGCRRAGVKAKREVESGDSNVKK